MRHTTVVLALLSFAGACILQAQSLVRIQAQGSPRLKPATTGGEEIAPASSIRGPMMGYTPDPSGSAVWPILGMPGAASYGGQLRSRLPFVNVTVSPSQDYALALDARSHRVVTGDLTDPALPFTPLPGAIRNSGRIVLSPQGSSAALLAHTGKMIQVVSGLPRNPAVSATLDLTGLPGTLGELAISDDGSTALAVLSDGAAAFLYRLGASGHRLIATAGRISALAFSQSGADAIFADAQANAIWLIHDVRGPAELIPLASEKDGISDPVGVALPSQGGYAAVANRKTGTISSVPLTGGLVKPILCQCEPTTLQPLGRDIYRLNDFSAGPLWVIQARASGINTAFVPAAQPAQSTETVTQGEVQ